MIISVCSLPISKHCKQSLVLGGDIWGWEWSVDVYWDGEVQEHTGHLHL